MKLKLPKRVELLGFIRKNKYILILGVLGAVLMLWPTSPSAAEKAVPSSSVSEKFDLEGFEKKLATLLSRIQGAGEVQVLLQTEGGERTVYASEGSEMQSAERSEREYAIAKSGGGSANVPVEEQRLRPDFTGAVVICEGAASSSVRLMVTNAVASATGLTTDRISVLPMK